MVKLVLKVLKNRWILRSLLQTLYFNFHYLPFKQAMKIPILLYKPHFLKLKGSLQILGGVKSGMIVLGKFTSVHHPNNGISLYLEGQIVFYGKCKIGNDSYVSVKKHGLMKVGDNFQATAGIKIDCAWHIEFSKNVLVGFDTFVIDNDMHKLTPKNGGSSPKPFGEIFIGEGVWLGFRNVVLKNTSIPNQCVVCSNSLLNKKYNCAVFSVLAGSPAKIVKTGLYLDNKNHVINFNDTLYE